MIKVLIGIAGVGIGVAAAKGISKFVDKFVTFDKFAENGINLTHPINIKKSSIKGFEEVIMDCIDEYNLNEKTKKLFTKLLTENGVLGDDSHIHIYCLYLEGGRTIFVHDRFERILRLFGKTDYNP